MLQRIQSIYLILAAANALGASSVFYLWKTNSGGIVFAKDNTYAFVAFLATGIMSLITLFLFKNRKLQFVLGRLNIILNFFLLGFFVYLSQNLSGETLVSEKGIGMFLPIISIVFIALANKAIKKDEDLVKSVDRLR
jgi:hypothetical protein